MKEFQVAQQIVTPTTPSPFPQSAPSTPLPHFSLLSPPPTVPNLPLSDSPMPPPPPHPTPVYLSHDTLTPPHLFPPVCPSPCPHPPFPNLSLIPQLSPAPLTPSLFLSALLVSQWVTGNLQACFLATDLTRQSQFGNWKWPSLPGCASAARVVLPWWCLMKRVWFFMMQRLALKKTK